MSKLIVLKILAGDFVRGYPVTLEIGEEGKPILEEISGSLPSAPEIPKLYENWKTDYWNLKDAPFLRNTGEIEFSEATFLEECEQSANSLINYIQIWLKSEDMNFNKIRKKLIENLQNESDEIRVFIQTEYFLLKKLPWHEWDIFANKLNVEITISPPEYSRANYSLYHIDREMRILAILGEKTKNDTKYSKINIKPDENAIKNLPNTEPVFLQQPKVEELAEHLRHEQGWDILFFAGHSSSSKDGESGEIIINADVILKIEELKKAFKKSIESGLQLAIFNSCDGLGLAKQLADLNIAQVIVMREPVPDPVAQKFAENFLKAFSGGQSVYQAVRLARENLKSFEQDFPGVSWLPVICQNPAQKSATWRKISIETIVPPPDSSETIQAKETWQCVHTLEGHSDAVRSVANAPNEQTIVSASNDKTIKLWNLHTGELLRTLTRHSRPIIAIAISPDGKTIASSSADQTINLWHLSTGELKSTLRQNSWITGLARSISFSPDGQILASGHLLNSKINLWHLPTQKKLRTITGHSWGVSSVAFSPDSKIVASGSYDSTIKLWNPQTGKLVRVLNGLSGWLSPVKSWLRRDEGISCIAISPDGQTLASSGSEEVIKLWHLDTGELKSILKSHSEAVNSLAFSPNGKMLASASDDNTIKVWDLYTRQNQILEHTDKVYSVAFSPDGKTLVSACEDKTVKVWQILY